MPKNTYKIADNIIEIISLHEEVHKYCKDYVSKENPDFSIKINQTDIDYERRKSASEDKKEGKAVRNFPDSYLETLAVYRKIAKRLLEDNIILFHGSVVAVDGIGYLFTAKSGTGKSTHTKLWREYFGERAFMVNDDKPLIKINENDCIVYGTPWDGKHRLSKNTSVPLKAVCILERSEKNHIEKITKSEAYSMLIQQVHRPGGAEKIAKLLNLIDKFSENVNLYKLGCNMDIEAAKIAYNGMKG